MSDSKIRVGLIGAGGNTRQRHIPGFQAIDGVELAVVCNRSETSSRRVAEEYGIPRVAKGWYDVVNDPEVDAVCIGTWPNMHAEVTVAALEASRHVLCEARMAMNLKEAERMLEAARKQPGCVAQLVPAPFSLNHDATIQRLLSENGQLHEVSVRHRSGAFADPQAPLSWRQDYALSGKNTLTMGILYETIQRWLGAGVDPTCLAAVASTVIPERPIDQDGASVAVSIPDGLSVIGHYNQGTRFHFDLSGVDGGNPVNEIRLVCDGGTLRFDFIEETLYFASRAAGGESLVEPDAGTAPGWRVEADFIESIREGQPVRLTSFDDGVRYMRFTERVWESWQSGAPRVAW